METALRIGGRLGASGVSFFKQVLNMKDIPQHYLRHGAAESSATLTFLLRETKPSQYEDAKESALLVASPRVGAESLTAVDYILQNPQEGEDVRIAAVALLRRQLRAKFRVSPLSANSIKFLNSLRLIEDGRISANIAAEIKEIIDINSGV